jgi:hypothetical protein
MKIQFIPVQMRGTTDLRPPAGFLPTRATSGLPGHMYLIAPPIPTRFLSLSRRLLRLVELPMSR